MSQTDGSVGMQVSQWFCLHEMISRERLSVPSVVCREPKVSKVRNDVPEQKCINNVCIIAQEFQECVWQMFQTRRKYQCEPLCTVLYLTKCAARQKKAPSQNGTFLPSRREKEIHAARKPKENIAKHCIHVLWWSSMANCSVIL